jgi:hypothetical protein
MIMKLPLQRVMQQPYFASLSPNECEHFSELHRMKNRPMEDAIVEITRQITEDKMIVKPENMKRSLALAGILSFGLGFITTTEAQSQTAGAVGTAPRIVATTPAVGATDVDPAIAEITVTFDRDMAGGFSWTGGGPEFPGRGGEKPRWRDKRTCVLPVKLQAGQFYRVGINSSSYQNFRSADGIPANTTAFYFTTKGAGKDAKAKMKTPEIVKIQPPNGAKDVDPKIKELRVTFDRPMGSGFSWTGSGPQFPASPTGQRAYWTEHKKTCVLPVDLKPDSHYRLGLNSPSHKSFQSAEGIPLVPVVYTFATKAR